MVKWIRENNLNPHKTEVVLVGEADVLVRISLLTLDGVHLALTLWQV